MDHRHGRRASSLRARRAAGIALGVATAALITPSIAAAGPLTPPQPPAGSAQYHWVRAGCVDTDRGFRSIASVKTHVKAIPFGDGKASSVYYQEVKVQIDKSVNSTNTMWRKVAAQSYDWSRFTRSQTPTYSTSGIRTGLQSDVATLSAKVTVWLKRKRPGPDKTVWRYKRRSGVFTCGGFTILPPGAAPPSVNPGFG